MLQLLYIFCIVWYRSSEVPVVLSPFCVPEQTATEGWSERDITCNKFVLRLYKKHEIWSYSIYSANQEEKIDIL